MNLEQIISEFYTPVYKSNRYITTLEHDSLIADTVKNVIYWNSLNKTFTPYQFLRFHGLDDSEIADFDIDISANLGLNIGSFDSTYQQYLFYGIVDNEFEYFKNRGLNPNTVEYFKLEVSQQKHAILIPYIKFGVRIGAIYRFLTNNKQQRYVVYVNEKITHWPHISYYKTFAKTAILFEGYFSTMRWMQYFRSINKHIHCYSLLNARPTLNKLTPFENYAKVFYIADSDSSGILAGLKIKELANWIKVINPSKMPDEMSNDEISKIIKQGY